MTHESTTDTALQVGAGGKPEWAMSRREIEADLRQKAGLPPVSNRGRWIVAAILALLLLAGAGYRFTQAGETEAPAAEATAERAEPVSKTLLPSEHLTLSPQTLRRTVSLSGTLVPERTATVSAETGGVIRSVAIWPGDPVRAGDVIAELATETLTTDLDAAMRTADATQAQVDLAEAELTRARSLASRGVTAAATVEQAESSVRNLRAGLAAQREQVRAAEIRLRDATVRAPFDGVISERTAEPGAYAGAGTALLSLVDPTVLRLEASSAVSAAGDVRPGMTVDLRVEGRTDAVRGTLSRISPVITEGARTVRIFATVPNPDGAILGGAFATGSVIVDERADALAVPADAVREDADGAYVLRVRDGVLERAGVRTAETWSGDVVRVEDGLTAGDVIVSAPLTDLAPGQAVTISER